MSFFTQIYGKQSRVYILCYHLKPTAWIFISNWCWFYFRTWNPIWIVSISFLFSDKGLVNTPHITIWKISWITVILKNTWSRTSLVVQWLRIHLPIQETWVPSLVQEDSTYHKATKPMCHDYWVVCHNCWSLCTIEPVFCNKRSHHNEKPIQLEKAWAQQQRLSITKNI